MFFGSFIGSPTDFRRKSLTKAKADPYQTALVTPNGIKKSTRGFGYIAIRSRAKGLRCFPCPARQSKTFGPIIILIWSTEETYCRMNRVGPSGCDPLDLRAPVHVHWQRLHACSARSACSACSVVLVERLMRACTHVASRCISLCQSAGV